MRTEAAMQWIRDALDSFDDGSRTFSSRHIGDLDVPSLSWIDAVGFLDSLSSDVPLSWNGRFSLALPMQTSTHLLAPPPADPERLAASTEDPSLYLVTADHLARSIGDGEEYRARIELRGVPASKVVEFASYRDARSVRNAWEFSNTVWVHHLFDQASSGACARDDAERA